MKGMIRFLRYMILIIYKLIYISNEFCIKLSPIIIILEARILKLTIINRKGLVLNYKKYYLYSYDSFFK